MWKTRAKISAWKKKSQQKGNTPLHRFSENVIFTIHITPDEKLRYEKREHVHARTDSVCLRKKESLTVALYPLGITQHKVSAHGICRCRVKEDEKKIRSKNVWKHLLAENEILLNFSTVKEEHSS